MFKHKISICFVLILVQIVFSAKCWAGNVVKVVGEKGHWDLSVNGKLFHLKGVGVSRIHGKNDNADYLKLAKELGANTVRTWGIDQGTQFYLDKAWQYGLFVDAGIWTNPAYPNGVCSYLKNDNYKEEIRKQTLDYVRKFKDHPAILFWNIGNETIWWTKDEDERVAYSKFLEQLYQEVHQLDPNHPIVYASAYLNDVDYILKYVPSIDIIGINAYGGFDDIHEKLKNRLNIPYMYTEYGSAGPWDVAKDIHGRGIEQSDENKAYQFRVYGRKINSYYGYCLGSFAFVIGDTTQNSYTWWNINWGDRKKAAYRALEGLLKNQNIAYVGPRISEFEVSKRKAIKPGERFTVKVTLKEGRGNSKALSFDYFISTELDQSLDEYSNVKIPVDIIGKGPEVTLNAPLVPGVYRVYVVVTDNKQNAATMNKTISVSQ